MLLGLLLAVAMLLAMALPQGQWNLFGAEKAQAATAQEMFDALPDASTVPTMTEAEKAQARKDLMAARQAWWGAANPNNPVDTSIDTSRGDALGRALTVYPKGVTADDVKQYIYANFTKPADYDGPAGGTVWPDAVWRTISAWGQDFTLTYMDDDATEEVPVETAADVVWFFGYSAYYRGTNYYIVLSKPLDGPLYGMDLLHSFQGSILIEDSGIFTGLQFLEDAYDAIAQKSGGRDTNEHSIPAYYTPVTPSSRSVYMPLLTLPKKQNAFNFNLPRVQAQLRNFSSTQYYPYEGYKVRSTGSTNVTIDTLMHWYTGDLNDASEKIDFNSKINLPDWLCTNLEYYTGCSMPYVKPTFDKNAGVSSSNSEGDPTNVVTTESNRINIAIPENGSDGNYQEKIAFSRLYDYYSNTALQSFSIDYFFRLNITYLTPIGVESPTALSGFRFKKVDENDSSKGLPGAVFEVYQKDRSGNEIAPRQARRTNGNIQFDQNGNIQWATGKIQVTSDAKGEVNVPDLEPGTYYYREIQAPSDYELDSTTEHEVTVSTPTDVPSGLKVSGGVGESKATLPNQVGLKSNEKSRQGLNWNDARLGQNLLLDDNTKLDTSKAEDYGGDVFATNRDRITVDGADSVPDTYKYQVIGYQTKDDALASTNGKVEYGGSASSGVSLSDAVAWVNTQISNKNLENVSPILRLEPVNKVVVDDSYLTGTAPTVTNKRGPQEVKGSLSFAKRDGDETSKALAGATFRLFECKAGAGKCGTGTSANDVINPDNPGDAWKQLGSDVTSGADGLVTFNDLTKPGEYRLVEVASPAGYAKPSGQWRVTYADRDTVEPKVEAVGEAPAFFQTARSAASVSPASTRASNSMLAVPNYKTIAVPSTGGRGWLISSLAGFGLLLAGVTVLSVESRRRCR
ncbi:MSCRAMM family protein [Bifidobacterium felsineum]|uniref:SpaA-like prealbumin fold domain-containing protein n=1 Tax=Bifidobacterium felsineum TaxID=2045440 RepID=A0A2M9HI44_9BIFI|nr:SpaA isopeptide-forming pilin-related protein [Bifidobacterium felsineum]PJM76508.1 hypothetical protein CSQ86_08425 [Bifidobacterium felsineum]